MTLQAQAFYFQGKDCRGRQMFLPVEPLRQMSSISTQEPTCIFESSHLSLASYGSSKISGFFDIGVVNSPSLECFPAAFAAKEKPNPDFSIVNFYTSR